MKYQEHLEAVQILTRFRGQLAHRYGKPMYMNMVKTLDHMCDRYGEVKTAKCASLDWHEAELALHHYWEKHKDEILGSQPEEIEPQEQRFHHVAPRSNRRSIAKRFAGLFAAILIALVIVMLGASVIAARHSDDVIASADRILEVYGR